jgi:hypothetical protein
MRGHVRRVTLATLLLACFVALSSAAPPRYDPRPDREPKNDAGGVQYWGTVTELTKTTITLQFEDDPPKCFPVSAILAAGDIPMQPRPIPNRLQSPYHVNPIEMYRFTDVKVGDLITISYSKVGGVVTCEHICICKRPGASVPPLPKEAEELRHPATQWKLQHPGQPIPKTLAEFPPPIPWHEMMNAHWNLEDRGIPYPEKFGNKRRWLTAPMPREVPPTPRPKA